MTHPAAGPHRELTVEERMEWGICPVCKATHGQKCLPAIGAHLGRNIYGETITAGAHLGRLQRAPFYVQEVPV